MITASENHHQQHRVAMTNIIDDQILVTKEMMFVQTTENGLDHAEMY